MQINRVGLYKKDIKGHSYFTKAAHHREEHVLFCEEISMEAKGITDRHHLLTD